MNWSKFRIYYIYIILSVGLSSDDLLCEGNLHVTSFEKVVMHAGHDCYGFMNRFHLDHAHEFLLGVQHFHSLKNLQKANYLNDSEIRKEIPHRIGVWGLVLEIRNVDGVGGCLNLEISIGSEPVKKFIIEVTCLLLASRQKCLLEEVDSWIDQGQEWLVDSRRRSKSVGWRG